MTNNWKGMVARAGAAAMALGLSACVIPYNRTIVPGVETRLVDARTGDGVAGAQVTVGVGPKSYDKAEPRIAVSGADGSVKTEPVKELIFVMPAMDVFALPGIMRVEAEGYEPYEGEARLKFGNYPAAPGPTVQLTPKEK